LLPKLPSKASTNLGAIHRAELDETLAEVLAETPDLVVIEDISLLEYAKSLRASHQNIKIVVDFHNVESALSREQDRSRLPKFLRGFSSVVFRKNGALLNVWTMRLYCWQMWFGFVPN
jgi:hypothetical protein